MPDTKITISDPVSAIVEAVSRVAVAIIENDTARRATMSEAARAEQDRIMSQVYDDFRAFLQSLKLVGEPKQ